MTKFYERVATNESDVVDLQPDHSIVSGSGASGVINIGSWTDLATISIPSAGTWIIHAYTDWAGASDANASTKSMAISENSGTTTTDHVTAINEVYYRLISSNTVNPDMRLTYVVTTTSAKNFYLKVQDGVGTNHNSNWGYQAVRM